MIKKVSIIIPTYNGEKYIQETIESCLNQSYNNIEIIVIDDCSTDNTLKIVKSYGDKIKLHINEKNQGISKNVNKGVKLSSGEYFILLGHDDILLPNHVKIIINEFEKDTVLVHCNANVIDKKSNIIRFAADDNRQIKKTQFIRYNLILNNVVHSTGTMINKFYFLQAGGWDESFKNYGEWLIWIKLSLMGNIKYSTKIKALYRRHDTNITNTFKEDKIKIELKKYYQVCEDTALLNIKNIFIRKTIKYLLPSLKNLVKLKQKIFKGIFNV